VVSDATLIDAPDCGFEAFHVNQWLESDEPVNVRK
jgi:hypothetical protein